MKTKILLIGAMMALVCASTQAQIPVTSATTTPTTGYYDQYYLPGAVVEAVDTIGSPNTNDAYAGVFANPPFSGNNDVYTYVSYGDRTSKAQSFTTGSSPLGYALKSFTFQQAQGTNGAGGSGTGWINNGTYFLLSSGDSLKVRVGSISGGTLGTSYTTILETNATYTGTSYNNNNNPLGVYFNFDLSGANLTLSPNTTYFVEIMTTAGANGNDHFELNNTMTNPVSKTFPTVYLNGQALVGNTGNDLDRTAAFSPVPNGGDFAFVAQTPAVGAPTVVATAKPAAAAPGQKFTITATITQGIGTVTNVSVDLRPAGLTNLAARLVLSNANVFTNTFTVSTNALIGATNLAVTAIQDTQPAIIGVGFAPFSVISASAPVIVQDTTPTNLFTAYVGQGVRFSATFAGVQPIFYNWQVSVDGGSTFTDIPGATNNSFTIPSAGLGDTGFYQLQATNAFGLTLSTYTYLTVNSGTPLFTWSAPIPFAGLTAEQILTNFPSNDKIAGALVAKNAGSPITVVLTNANNQPIVFAGSGNWSVLSGGAGFLAGANTNLTGNANFNLCLNDGYNDNATHSITLSNLVVGQPYQVQLFALDNRSGLTPDVNSRFANWQDPADATDTAETFAMNDNVYTLGTFTANSSTMTIQQNMLNVTPSGNFNCLVLRTVGWDPAPYITRSPVNVSGFLGTNVSLIASAAGDTTVLNPAVTYQWVAGPSGGPYSNLVEGAKYAGTTTGTLTISNLIADDSIPVYALIAANSVGSVTTKEANVYFQSLPVPPAPGSYGAYALSNNPVALWILNETNNPASGLLVAYDYTGHGNSGTYRTTAKNAFNGILGPQPPAFPGFVANEGALQPTVGDNNSDVAVPLLNLNTNPAAISTNGVTIAMWIKPAAGIATFSGLLMYRNNTTEGFGFGGTQVGGMAGLGYTWNNNSAATYNFSSGLYPPVGVWSYVGVVVTSNSATLFLYYTDPVSGAAVRLSAVNARTHNAYTFNGGTTFIGGDNGGGAARVFNGSIAGVALYNSALNSGQLLQQYSAGLGVAGVPPLVSGVSPDVYYPAPLPAGRIAIITANANGTFPLTNQWTFNGADLTDGPYLGATVSGSQTATLTISNVTYNNLGSYQFSVTNGFGQTNSATVRVGVLPATLVGQWLSGTQSLADLSGYSPAGVHDATLQAGSTYWTNDVPPIAPPGSSALVFVGAGLTVANSSTLDAGYTNTFDSQINNGLTVMCWAKGFPGGWNPFVSKYGEGPGWQLRCDGSTGVTNACWTVRGTGGSVQLGAAVFGNAEDMATRTISTGTDGQWHHYVGTYSPVTGLRSLYIDGKLAAQETGNGVYNLASAEHLMIGGKDQPPGNNFTGYFTGEMYDVRIYNYALPEDQVVAVAKAVPQTPETFVTAGSLAKFTTPGINAAPPFTGYQWQLNGANLTDGPTISGSGTISLAVSNITVANAGVYQLLVTNVAGVTTSSIASLTVQPTTMVGQWLSGAQSLADVSGFSPAGVHDAGVQSGTVGWSADVPSVAPGGSYSLAFTNAGLIISNSSTFDAGYTNTFDNQIASGVTIMCWAKPLPGVWNPWVSKWGENIYGWQLRDYGANPNYSAWTMRGTGGVGDMAATFASNNGQWNHYTGTYDASTGIRSLYIDGVLAAQQTGQGPYNPTDFSHLMIGAKDSGGNTFGNYFTGNIYDVRVYNYALSQSQIQAAVPGISPAGLTPVFTSKQFVTDANGHQIVLAWPFGSLLEATNVAGPWTPSGATSPYTNIVNMTVPDLFFKLSNP